MSSLQWWSWHGHTFHRHASLDQVSEFLCCERVETMVCRCTSCRVSRIPTASWGHGLQWTKQILACPCKPMYFEELFASHVACNRMGWDRDTSWCSRETFVICRYTRSYSNNLTFATVKVWLLDALLSHFPSLCTDLVCTPIRRLEHGLLTKEEWFTTWIKYIIFCFLIRAEDILLQSTCQSSALLCLQGGFLVNLFDGVNCSLRWWILCITRMV